MLFVHQLDMVNTLPIYSKSVYQIATTTTVLQIYFILDHSTHGHLVIVSVDYFTNKCENHLKSNLYCPNMFLSFLHICYNFPSSHQFNGSPNLIPLYDLYTDDFGEISVKMVKALNHYTTSHKTLELNAMGEGETRVL